MFRNRKDAAEQLAMALSHYRGKGVLVLGIPRGGAETGYYVARDLDAEFSLVICRKLGYPFSPETAMGAIAEDGSTYIAEIAKERQADINEAIERESAEVKRRVARLRKGKPLPPIKDRTVILTDDGIATGATLFAAIRLCKNHGAARIVAAAPVAGERMEHVLNEMVDEVVILEKPWNYTAVSQAYESFTDLSDDEALSFVQRWEREHQEA